MGDLGRVFVLEAGSRNARPPSMRFEPNRRVEPLSIGSKGQWSVSGPGVRDVHGYVAFDGSVLYLQSANPLHPIRIGQVAVGERWHAVNKPAQIQIGGVTIEFKFVDESTGAEERPKPADNEATLFEPVPAGMAARGQGAEGENATLFAPLPNHSPKVSDRGRASKAAEPAVVIEDGSDDTDDTVFAPRPENRPALNTFVDPGGASEETAPTPLGDPPAPIDLPPTKTPIAAATERPRTSKGVLDQFRDGWKKASVPKRMTLVLMPFALVLSAAGLVRHGSHRVARTGAAASPSASAAMSAGTAVATSTPSATAASQVAGVPSTDVPGAASGDKRTPQRIAVDAVAAGAFGEAARRYAELADQHPDQRVYREAARILRAKIDAGPTPPP